MSGSWDHSVRTWDVETQVGPFRVEGLSAVKEAFTLRGGIPSTGEQAQELTPAPASSAPTHPGSLSPAQANTETLNHNKAVYCVAAAHSGSSSGGGAGLVAFGGAERALRVWDLRTRAGEGLALRALASHADWISALAWHPTSGHHVVSASYDRSLKLWDLRASVPLHTLAGQHADKALCVAWAGPALVASGGADCKLRTAAVEVAAA